VASKIKSFLTSKNWNDATKAIVIIFIVIAFFSLVAVNFLEPFWVFGIDVAILLLILLLKFPVWGLYAMAATFPFVGWQIKVANMSAPVVDVLALMLMTAILLRYFVHLPLTKDEFNLKNFPGLFFAILFFAVSALSVLQNQYNEMFFEGVKYLFRPLIFFYLMFVVLPTHLIKEKKIFLCVLKIIVAVGIFSGLLGLLSVLFSVGPWYLHRAVPFALGNLNLLGGNHNAIAEVLTVTIPLAFLLMYESEKIRLKGLYVLIMIFLTLILLLTFSRSGWLAVLIQLLILFFVQYKHKINRYALVALVLCVLFVPLIFYFVVWNQVDWVQSSNSSRLMMLQVAWNYFKDAPIMGYGLNSFQNLMANTFVYTVDFGDPLDSHGFVQKVATESGLLGLVSFLGLLGYLFYKYLKAYVKTLSSQSKTVILCLILMFCGIVFFELFSTSYYIATMWLPIGVGLSGLRFYK